MVEQEPFELRIELECGDNETLRKTVTLFLKDFFGESVGVNVVSLKEMMIAKKISKEDWEPGVED